MHDTEREREVVQAAGCRTFSTAELPEVVIQSSREKFTGASCAHSAGRNPPAVREAARGRAAGLHTVYNRRSK